MGEIHVNMFVTMDGVIEANGGPDPDSGSEFAFPGWQGPLFDDDSEARVVADVQASDALLLGRRTYDIFRQAWPHATDATGRVFNSVPKYVASRGTPELSWSESTHIADVAEEVPAPDLEALTRTLFDRLNLWTYPVALGQGQKLFTDETPPSRFVLEEPPTAFPKGAVLMRYRPVAGLPATTIMSDR